MPELRVDALIFDMDGVVIDSGDRNRLWRIPVDCRKGHTGGSYRPFVRVAGRQINGHLGRRLAVQHDGERVGPARFGCDQPRRRVHCDPRRVVVLVRHRDRLIRQDVPGVVGTGGIANSMARMIEMADNAELAAVSSRRMETAREFADAHSVPNAFDSWAEMSASDTVDAIYVATPTSAREEICIAAAANGKHVLGEKPFASLPSVNRITAACRHNNVAFMDGTHFVHHPRTLDIKANRNDRLGFVWSVASAFQFNLPDRGNIRFNPELEPMGAIGDAGWYNMRAAVEYLPPDVELDTVSSHLRRDAETGAAISGTGVLDFTDGSTSTWNCGFDSGAVVMDLRLTGGSGVISTGRMRIGAAVRIASRLSIPFARS